MFGLVRERSSSRLGLEWSEIVFSCGLEQVFIPVFLGSVSRAEAVLFCFGSVPDCPGIRVFLHHVFIPKSSIA